MLMLDAIRALIRGEPAEAPQDPGLNPVHLAACALLLEIAYADGNFSAPERAHIDDVLQRHFGLSADAGHALLAAAEQARAKSVDHFQFTRVLQSNYDLGQKMVLAEVMWGLALADGELADRESYLTRKICRLLELEAGYLATAKAEAAKKAGKA